MLEDLKPQPKIEAPKGFRPGVEFDGEFGEGITPGFTDKPNFDEFLAEAGFDPSEIEIVGTPRTSRWQRYDGEWLTSWRFQFRKKNVDIDLPLLWRTAKNSVKQVPVKTDAAKAFVIVAADFQIGKVGSRGNTQDLLSRIFESFKNIEAEIKKTKPGQIIILDGGDIIEGFDNAANMAQLQSNDLSLMQQVDLACAIMWDLIKIAAKYAPVKYVSTASNHCQFRRNGQRVGKPGLDDWGIMITQQLRRLAVEKELPVQFFIPQPDDESVAIDVFDDGFHILGLVHGHQANRPDNFPTWLMKQAWGLQPLAAATIICSGHFHHTRIEELGQSPNGGSRWWIQGSTSDNGSDWFRLSSGSDSQTGITCFMIEEKKHFKGTVCKL